MKSKNKKIRVGPPRLSLACMRKVDEIRYTCPRDIRMVLTPNDTGERESMFLEACRIVQAQEKKVPRDFSLLDR